MSFIKNDGNTFTQATEVSTTDSILISQNVGVRRATLSQVATGLGFITSADIDSFVTSAEASALAQGIVDGSGFITSASAASLFLTKTSSSAFMKQTEADALYLTKVSSSAFIKQTEADALYLTKTSSSAFMKPAEADALYLTKTSSSAFAKFTDIPFTSATLGIQYTGQKISVSCSSSLVAMGTFSDVGYNFVEYNWSPAAGTQAVRFAVFGKTNHVGVSADISGVGHYGGVIGYGYKDALGTDALVIGVEGRVGVNRGTANVASAFITAFDTCAENSAGGTALYGVGFYMAPLTNHGQYQNKYFGFNSNSDWIFRTDGIAEVGLQQVVPRNRLTVANNRYYGIEGINALFSATPMTSSVLWMAPWVCPEKKVWTRVGVVVDGAVAGCNGVFGLYADSAGAPGAKIFESSSVPFTTIGIKEATVSVTVFPGTYWLGCRALGGTGNPTLVYAGVDSWKNGTTGATAQDGVAYMAATVSSLPASASSLSFGGGGFAPYMFMRVV